eukprot:scaffold46554_cov55-Attheya_sp.AAC.5
MQWQKIGIMSADCSKAPRGTATIRRRTAAFRMNKGHPFKNSSCALFQGCWLWNITLKYGHGK